MTDIKTKLEAEAAVLDALMAICENPLHEAPLGCPYCRRDERHRDLMREAVRELKLLEEKKS